MRIGLVELLLILLIASLTIGPSAALWVDRWMRRAQKTSAAAARRRAAQEAQRAAEREEVLQRFQKLSIVFVLCAAVALIWGLVLRPIEAAPTPYTAPDVRQETGAQTAAEGGVLELAPYTEISALRENNGWLYAAAKSGKNGCLLRMQPDGTGRTEVLTTAGEITDFAFAPDGTIWMTTLESEGGRLYRVNSDQWGVTVELTVSQIDGRALSCPTAVAVASDGVVYFTDLAAARARHKLAQILFEACVQQAHLHRVAEQQTSGRRRSQGPAAYDQHRAGLRFEGVQTLRYRGLGDRQPARGAFESTFFDHGGETFE